MIFASARVTLKQHRVEIGIAAAAALVIAVSALIVTYRLVAVALPAGCLEDWISETPTRMGECRASVTAFLTISHDEGDMVLTTMLIVPFLLGLLGGVPIVGRELEARTAQTAWSLSPSRRRWLLRQVLPVVLLLGVAIAFTAFASEVLFAAQRPIGQASCCGGDLDNYEMHGPVVIGRAAGAFGSGLLLGALFGRTLPAFLYGAALALGLSVAVSVARENWLDTLPTVIISDACCSQSVDFQGHMTGYEFVAPGGTRLDDEDAYTLIPAGNAAPDQWLVDHGYRHVAVGVAEHVARQWETYDGLTFIVVGLVGVAGAAVIVDRRRPT